MRVSCAPMPQIRYGTKVPREGGLLGWFHSAPVEPTEPFSFDHAVYSAFPMKNDKVVKHFDTVCRQPLTA